MKFFIFSTCIFILLACKESKIKSKEFNFILYEPCMLLNYEQDNTMEGNYLRVQNIKLKDSVIEIKVPENFFVNNSNCQNWVIGWGTNEPLYDSGCENLRTINKINSTKFYLGELKRGKGFPSKNQRLVFWNQNPSNFKNSRIKPIIDPEKWPEFAGKSIHFGALEYDSLLKKWVLLFNECDTSKIQIYGATSNNLINWDVVNMGKPLLKIKDFEQCNWGKFDENGMSNQCPFISDAIYHDKVWYLFFHGFDKNGKRNIGIATSKTSLTGPFTLIRQAVISPGKNGEWDDIACFYPKVRKYKDHFIMFYDGKCSTGEEKVGIARSKNLIEWKKDKKNPVIGQHYGWRSSLTVSEPNHIYINNDTIILMAAGAKKFKMGFWHHYITRRMYLDKSGNVDDAQLGAFISTDGGNTFFPHKNNPVFTNNYASRYENEHLGGNFKFITVDSTNYIIYQAKTSFEGLKYNILIREKSKINNL